MRTAADHLRKHPAARPSTLAFIERRNAVVEHLKRETEAARAPTRKSIIERFMPWFAGRRA
ncbi:hypothetical protein [Rhizobium bangladeshense]|uniref:hypothetical protein n=1 Tax=Rhizobium bangladeshense TaxID=1138189 RepID=UPI001C8402BF|nr:hypothetical protein [Rhizobium bangladeshense]MBX4889823.1 hypothetical protein [Rhizobium bangladeshense]